MRALGIGKWMVWVLVLLAGQSALGGRVRDSRHGEASNRHATRGHATQMHVPASRETHARPAQARLVEVSRRGRRVGRRAKGRAKAPVVSRAQMELAEEMAREAYMLGERLPGPQRVALLSRLLYTLRPEVMAVEKKQWAEELFALAQQMPGGSEDVTGLNGRPSMRDEAIATAAARLALYDSDRALALLDTLPSERGRREDARSMASRLVFATYMQRHGAAGAQTLLAHARRWGAQGGFPYGASTAALARLSADEEAAEDFFRQALTEFERGQEGAFGIAEFAALLERAVAMEAISEEAAEEAGRAIVTQAAKLTARPPEAAAPAAQPAQSATTATGVNDQGPESASGETSSGEARGAEPPSEQVLNQEGLTPEAQQRLAEALANVRAAAPKAYTQAAQEWPALLQLQPVHLVSPVEELKVDPVLQASFAELAEALRQHSGPEAEREIVARGLQRINELYRVERGDAAGVDRSALPRSGRRSWVPDRQSWALISLSAYAAPFSIAQQLRAINDPFWRAYFMAIAAQQVGEPTRVADPTARRVLVKEEAEPEE